MIPYLVSPGESDRCRVRIQVCHKPHGLKTGGFFFNPEGWRVWLYDSSPAANVDRSVYIGIRSEQAPSTDKLSAANGARLCRCVRSTNTPARYCADQPRTKGHTGQLGFVGEKWRSCPNAQEWSTARYTPTDARCETGSASGCVDLQAPPLVSCIRPVVPGVWRQRDWYRLQSAVLVRSTRAAAAGRRGCSCVGVCAGVFCGGSVRS